MFRPQHSLISFRQISSISDVSFLGHMAQNKEADQSTSLGNYSWQRKASCSKSDWDNFFSSFFLMLKKRHPESTYINLQSQWLPYIRLFWTLRGSTTCTSTFNSSEISCHIWSHNFQVQVYFNSYCVIHLQACWGIGKFQQHDDKICTEKEWHSSMRSIIVLWDFYLLWG